MDGNGRVSECLYHAVLARRLWTVETDVYGLTCNVRDNDTIRLHVSESPGVSLGAAEARQLKVIVEVVRKRIVSGRCCNIC